MNKVTFPIANGAGKLYDWYSRVSSKHCPYARAIRVWRASKRHNEKINTPKFDPQKFKKREVLIKHEKEKSIIDIGKSVGYLIIGAVGGFVARGCV